MEEDNRSMLVGGSSKSITIEDLPNRLDKFYEQWQYNDHNLWGNSDVITVQTPSSYKTRRSLTSSILSVWLFGLEFLDTVFIFTKTHIHCLSSDYHGCLLSVLQRATVTAAHPLILRTYEMSTTDGGIAQMDTIFGKIREEIAQMDRIFRKKRKQFNGESIIYVGLSSPASVYDTWFQERMPSNLRTIDVTNGFAELFVVKNNYELDNIEKSAYLNYTVMDECMVKTLREIVLEDEDASHWDLAQMMMKCIVNPAAIGVQLKHEWINICHPPVIQSGEGDDFNFEPSVTSNNKNLIFVSKNVVTCSLSSSFNDYCSYVARTFLIKPSISQKKAYMVLLANKICWDGCRD